MRAARTSTAAWLLSCAVAGWMGMAMAKDKSAGASPPAAAAGGDSQPATAFVLTSPAFAHNAVMPFSAVYSGYGCGGGNQSPALNWSGAPAGTQSFALVVHDPDAPRKEGWTHWAVYDIPAAAKGLPGNAGAAGGKNLPTGAKQGKTDFGEIAWGGPCPPPGPVHHYNFTLYALKTAVLPVKPGADVRAIEAAAKSHSLSAVTLTGLWSREK
ncbi:MAG: hypothetical protein GMKNLPBB_02217 [Myxococcota bacterium]|nr:hypothetical protein [Myxococcota bacterium]